MSLRASEWVLVGSFLLLFSSIVLLSQIHRHKNKEEIAALSSHEKISVVISGAVAKPGTYSVVPGTSLESVLKKSRPKRFANLRNIDGKQRLEESLELQIEELTEISVRVEGAVEEPLNLQLPVGTRLCDLKSKVECTDGADVGIFKKRRLLRDGEVIEVSQKEEGRTEIGAPCGRNQYTSHF